MTDTNHAALCAQLEQAIHDAQSYITNNGWKDRHGPAYMTRALAVHRDCLTALSERPQLRKLHIAFNVALYRTSSLDHHLPACAGPDCAVCAEVLKVFRAAGERRKELLMKGGDGVDERNRRTHEDSIAADGGVTHPPTNTSARPQAPQAETLEGIWVSNDPRDNGRRVRVLGVQRNKVAYRNERSNRLNSAHLPNFLGMFTKVDSGEPASAPPSVGWQPIETHYHDGERVLVALADGRVGEARWWGEKGWRWMLADLNNSAIDPTHWMPLPPAP